MSAHLSPEEEKSALTDALGFESGLRRDLSRAPPFAYERCVGGALKRGLDLGIAVFFAPIWASALLVAIIWLGVKGFRPLLISRNCIGYGGRGFRCVSLNFMPSPPARTGPVVDLAEAARAYKPVNDLRSIAARLPQMLLVLRGDMSLVGPSPRTRTELDQLRSARRAYLSARPGLISVGGDEKGESASQCKAYQQCWSLQEDIALIVRAALGRRHREASQPDASASAREENQATKKSA